MTIMAIWNTLSWKCLPMSNWEAEYGDYMREHQNGPLSREDLPTALDNDYRTDEEAPYLRKKYFDEEYHAEYDFKNHAITTVVADDEDEAWDNFAKGDEAWQQWEIVEVREGESSNFLHWRRSLRQTEKPAEELVCRGQEDLNLPSQIPMVIGMILHLMVIQSPIIGLWTTLTR